MTVESWTTVPSESDLFRDHIEAKNKRIAELETENASLKLKAELAENTAKISVDRWADIKAENARLAKIAGLLANPAIQAAVEKHIAERYKAIKLDSCGSAVHRVYEIGDALFGPSVVVEWDDRQFWFAPDGNGVEVDEFPNPRTATTAENTRLRVALSKIDELRNCTEYKPNDVEAALIPETSMRDGFAIMPTDMRRGIRHAADIAHEALGDQS